MARDERGVGDLTWYKGEWQPKVSCDGDGGSGYWSSGVAKLRTRTRDEVAALEARSKDEIGKRGWGLLTRGVTKMGLVGTGVVAWEVTEARILRGVKGQGRLMRSGMEGKRHKTMGDRVWTGDKARVAMVDKGRT